MKREGKKKLFVELEFKAVFNQSHKDCWLHFIWHIGRTAAVCK